MSKSENDTEGLTKLSFGRRLQLARQEKAERDNGCSQMDVVNFIRENVPGASMTRQSYSDYENGKRKRPPHHNIVTMLAFFFNKPLSALAEYQWLESDEAPSRADELTDLEFISDEDWVLLKTMVDHMVNKQTKAVHAEFVKNDNEVEA